VSLTPRDLQRLEGVNADLVRVVKIAADMVPLMVIEGLRTRERQAELYAIGRTKPGKPVTWTLASKHCDGLAVDVAPLPLDWNDRKAFFTVAGAMHAAAQRIGVALRHGGDWDGDGVYGERGESDLPHFELRA
jgi:peptidoglycan L-alanyl-D-glutamate endopeptidase CwlK